MHKVIAIDGPSAAGKSTVARAVSRRLGFLYVDSGALYRIVTWQALQRGVDPDDPEAVAAFVGPFEVEFAESDGAIVYRVAGALPGDAIRRPEVNRAVSPVSKVPEVREKVTGWLRALRARDNLVVEGRDIGSVVFPDATARFYLDASPEERARRRFQEEREKGIPGEAGQVLKGLLRRDRIDSTRANAPLRIAPGAIVIDSTHLGIDAVVDQIVGAVCGNS